MHSRHIVIIAAALAVGFGMKLFFLTSPTAEANVEAVIGAQIDIAQLHRNAKNLPVQKIDDMSVGID